MRRRIGNRLDGDREGRLDGLDPLARVQGAVLDGRIPGMTVERAQRLDIIPSHVDGRRVFSPPERSARAAFVASAGAHLARAKATLKTR
jgi:hypothetical protein